MSMSTSYKKELESYSALVRRSGKYQDQTVVSFLISFEMKKAPGPRDNNLATNIKL